MLKLFFSFNFAQPETKAKIIRVNFYLTFLSYFIAENK